MFEYILNVNREDLFVSITYWLSNNSRNMFNCWNQSCWTDPAVLEFVQSASMFSIRLYLTWSCACNRIAQIVNTQVAQRNTAQLTVRRFWFFWRVWSRTRQILRICGPGCIACGIRRAIYPWFCLKCLSLHRLGIGAILTSIWTRSTSSWRSIAKTMSTSIRIQNVVLTTDAPL